MQDVHAHSCLHKYTHTRAHMHRLPMLVCVHVHTHWLLVHAHLYTWAPSSTCVHVKCTLCSLSMSSPRSIFLQQLLPHSFLSLLVLYQRSQRDQCTWKGETFIRSTFTSTHALYSHNYNIYRHIYQSMPLTLIIIYCHTVVNSVSMPHSI